jgi:hypothetical protein
MNAIFVRSRWAGIPGVMLLSLFLWLVSCQRDDGFASPSDERSLRPLGTFVGKATPGDTASLHRWTDLAHPKVTVLWRGVGLRDNILHSDQSSIDVQLPFAFSLNLLQPPPEEVTEAPDIAFGIFSLFSDQNRNGSFDRLSHPDLDAGYARIDSLIRESGIAKANLLAVAEIRKRTPQSEQYYLEASGTLIRDDNGKLDTIAAFANPLKVNGIYDYLKNYQRILGNQNRWERFFDLRKKSNQFYHPTSPAAGHYLGVNIRFDRAVFPRPGLESEFDLRLEKAVDAAMNLDVASTNITIQAFRSGALDYPFTGYGQPGQDWMAGRAIQDLLVFFRTQATLDTLLAAYLTGSFRISHIERLHPGYNLFHCDDQYDCDVREPGDSVIIYLGTSEAFFNAPATLSANPVPSNPKNRPLPPPATAFAPWQGRYALNGSDTVSLVLRNGELWYEGWDAGLLRVLPFDSLGFQSPIFDLQGVLTRRIAERLSDRLVQYSRGLRFVALSLGEPVTPGLLARIEKASDFEPADIADSLVARCPGKYDYGGDTLRIANAGGDSLRADIPGFLPMIFHAVGDSLFQCPWGELSLEFQAPAGSGYRRVVFRNGSGKKVVPVFNPAPSNLVNSARTEMDGMVWDSGNQGSGRDLFVGLDRKSRYGCSEDGAFLRPGDGFFADFSRSGAIDSISQRQGGDFATFRFPGMKGKVVVFQLRDCAERTAAGKRIGVSIWGGAEPQARNLLYGDYQWMAADPGGIYWTFDSLAIDSDPYYLTLKQENTQDKPFANAFDGYRLGFRP